jgi:hypothetical protein
MEAIRELYSFTPEDEVMLPHMLIIRNTLLIILKGPPGRGKWRSTDDMELLKEVVAAIPRFTHDWFHTKVTLYLECASCKLRCCSIVGSSCDECRSGRYGFGMATKPKKCHIALRAPCVIVECCEHEETAYETCDVDRLYDRYDMKKSKVVRNSICDYHAQIRFRQV